MGDNIDAASQGQAISPEILHSIMDGEVIHGMISPGEVSDLTSLAGLTEDMIAAGVENYRHDSRFEPDSWAVKRAFLAMYLVSPNPDPAVVASFLGMLRGRLQPK